MNLSPRKLARELVGPAIAVAIVLAGRASFADQYTVPTGSMIPTVRVGDRVLVNKHAYGLRVPLTERYLARFDAPSRGEVVVLDSPVDGQVLLKRVVALPGDRVEVREGRLTVNGREVPYTPLQGSLQEALGAHPHPISLADGGGRDLAPVTVPPERYLVMGDNRGNSFDGRYFGFVRRDAILGRALGVFLREGSPVWRPL